MSDSDLTTMRGSSCDLFYGCRSLLKQPKRHCTCSDCGHTRHPMLCAPEETPTCTAWMLCTVQTMVLRESVVQSASGVERAPVNQLRLAPVSGGVRMHRHGATSTLWRSPPAHRSALVPRTPPTQRRGAARITAPHEAAAEVQLHAQGVEHL